MILIDWNGFPCYNGYTSEKTGAHWEPVFSFRQSIMSIMKNKIIIIALVSTTALLSQGFKVFAAIIPSEVIALSNAERREAGLPMLSENAVLDQVAQAKADDMATEGYFSHTSPSGVTPWDWFREAKYEYRYAGENLAIHFHDATSQERAWMESKKHCENILSPKYREIGVAVREMTWEGRRTTVAVQSFGTQMRDENTLNLTETGRVVCPKVFPSVLGSSMPSDTHGGVIGAVTTFLSDTATQYKIDTVRLLLLLLIALMQTAGLMTVLSLATHDRWLRKW